MVFHPQTLCTHQQKRMVLTMTVSFCKTGLDRRSIFGFSCNRCLACCRHKKIQLNPYEIARLANNRGLSTTEFINRYTTNSGAVLQFEQAGTCVFLNTEGCAVHSDRPLVCRLYPLGRHVPFSGSETFSQIELEEECKGIFHETGNVKQYLDEQGALPFMHAADQYLDLLWFLMDLLSEQITEPSESGVVHQAMNDFSNNGNIDQQVFWMDMDAAITDYCQKSRVPIPKDINEKMAIHIKAVRAWTA